LITAPGHRRGGLDGASRRGRDRDRAGERGPLAGPSGLVNDPSIRYKMGRRGIRVLTYYVKATTGARVVVTCSRGCRRTVTKGRGRPGTATPRVGC